jgi:hypothetical protein
MIASRNEHSALFAPGSSAVVVTAIDAAFAPAAEHAAPQTTNSTTTHNPRRTRQSLTPYSSTNK